MFAHFVESMYCNDSCSIHGKVNWLIPRSQDFDLWPEIAYNQQRESWVGWHVGYEVILFPLEDEEMKQVYATRIMVEADVVKSILEENNIRCVLWDSRIGTVYPVVEIRVMVEDEDREKAEKIIEDYQSRNTESRDGG